MKQPIGRTDDEGRMERGRMARRVDRVCKACEAACPSRYGIPDPCLGTLPGVRNACCGHGNGFYCYVQLDSGELFRSYEAAVRLRVLGGDPAAFTTNDPDEHTGALRGWRACNGQPVHVAGPHHAG